MLDSLESSGKKLVIAVSSPSAVCHSDSEGSDKLESIDDMPVLKRALQAPPLVNTNKLMDEAYRHHKKFRAAARKSDTEPHSPSTTTGHLAAPLVPSPSPRLVELSSPISSSTLASTHSTLLKTLEQPSRYLNEQQLKRTDLIHNIIMSTEAVNAPAHTAPYLNAMHATPPSSASQPLQSYQAQLFTSSSSSVSSPNKSEASNNNNITVMYPSGYYHHIPVASTAAGVCPFTGRSANNSGSSPTSSHNISNSQFPSFSHQHLSPYAKSSPEVAAAAAGLLVIGSSLPPVVSATVPSNTHHHSNSSQQAQLSVSGSGSLRSLSPNVMHQHHQGAGSPYSHLQRCLTGTTAPIGLAPSLLPPATAAGHELEEDDAQPLNLSKKPSPPPSMAPSPRAAPSPASSLKMEVE